MWVCVRQCGPGILCILNIKRCHRDFSSPLVVHESLNAHVVGFVNSCSNTRPPPMPTAKAPWRASCSHAGTQVAVDAEP